MKAFTDLEQSKKLAEILPLESADMYYFLDPTPAGNIYHIVTPQIDFGIKTREPEYNEGDIPCWSLAALLEAMPKYIRKYDGRVYRNYSLNLYRSYYHCCNYSFGLTTTDDDDKTLYCVGRDNWVDAVFEMIIKLHELNLL